MREESEESGMSGQETPNLLADEVNGEYIFLRKDYDQLSFASAITREEFCKRNE